MTERWMVEPPRDSTRVGELVACTWARCKGPADHEHTIQCLMVWHDCGEILGGHTVAPGARFGWRPTGVEAHTLVSSDLLTITASVYWPDCCGLHGFITEGRWIDA